MDKRFQNQLIGIARKQLKKYKRKRKLKDANLKSTLVGGSGVVLGSTAQDGPT